MVHVGMLTMYEWYGVDDGIARELTTMFSEGLAWRASEVLFLRE